MALSLALPSLPPALATFLTDGERSAPRPLWGEESQYGGHRDPLARFSNNVTLAHVLPIAVKLENVESFRTSKALQSDVGSLMVMTQNTRRRVPRHPTPAVFPRNEPERVDHYGRPFLTRPTRDSLEQCTDNLYVRPWASRTLPDHSQEVKRSQRTHRNHELLQRRQAGREPFNDYEAFRYTTVYRESYSKHSLIEDQAKIYLPPIQRKSLYINEPDEDKEEDTTQEHGSHQNQQEDSEDNIRPLPYSESLVNIRSRLWSEGWALPNIYTKCHPLQDEEYFPCETREVRPQRQYSHTEAQMRPRQNRISCDSVNLTRISCERPTSSKRCSEGIKTRCTNVAQTRISYPSPPSVEPNRRQRRVSFNSSPPEVRDFRPASPFKPYFSLRNAQTTPDMESYEYPDEDLGTDEMISAGYNRRTVLPRLQMRDFKTFGQARQHQRHVDTVPDLRDNTTYTKRVNFNGINSSVFRG